MRAGSVRAYTKFSALLDFYLVMGVMWHSENQSNRMVQSDSRDPDGETEGLSLDQRDALEPKGGDR